MNSAANLRSLTSYDEITLSAPKPSDDFILRSLPDVLTLEQVASVLQLAVATARQMCREKRLRSFKCGKQWRVPKTWLMEFIECGGN
jgi:excisionase family DNA binding protein